MTNGAVRALTTSNGIATEFCIDIAFRHKHVEPPKPGEELRGGKIRLRIDYQ